MKFIPCRCAIVLFLLLSLASPSSAESLSEHLQFLKPLLGKEWVGGYVGSESSSIQIELRFDQILGGHVVRYVREVDAAYFAGVTQFYWHPEREVVCFISLNTRGIVGEGVVSVEGGSIVLRGKSHRADGTTEFITKLEIDSTGTLRDTFLRMKDSKWVQGHLQEFTSR